MSNFNFLKPSWPEFVEDARAVERLVNFDPWVACGRARHLIEQVVLWMFENDEDLTLPFDTSFGNNPTKSISRKLLATRYSTRSMSSEKSGIWPFTTTNAYPRMMRSGFARKHFM